MIDKDKLRLTAYDAFRGSDRITKDQFREAATAAINSATAITDDLWEASLVSVVLKFRNNYEVIVGIRDAEEPDDFDAQATIDELSLKVNRYTKALCEIASDDFLKELGIIQ